MSVALKCKSAGMQAIVSAHTEEHGCQMQGMKSWHDVVCAPCAETFDVRDEDMHTKIITHIE